MSLQGRRILVVRPIAEPGKGDDDPFILQLKNAGARVLHYPVMTLTAFKTGREVELIETEVHNIDHYDTVIFVSRSAARLGIEWIQQIWPRFPEKTRVFAVGKSTADLLADADIKACFPELDMTSEGLLALPQLQRMQHRKVLIFRGEGGRETLARKLRSRGAMVTYAELYRRVANRQHQTEIGAALATGVDGIVIHSGELLVEFLHIVNELQADIHNTPVVVPGERVAALARQAGLGRVVVASNAMPQSMVSALNGCYI